MHFTNDIAMVQRRPRLTWHTITLGMLLLRIMGSMGNTVNQPNNQAMPRRHLLALPLTQVIKQSPTISPPERVFYLPSASNAPLPRENQGAKKNIIRTKRPFNQPAHFRYMYGKKAEDKKTAQKITAKPVLLKKEKSAIYTRKPHCFCVHNQE